MNWISSSSVIINVTDRFTYRRKAGSTRCLDNIIYNQRRAMFAFILLTVSVGKCFSVIACVRSAFRACACPSLLFPSRCDKAYLMYGTRRNTTNFSFHWHFFSSSQNSSIANPKSICGEHHGVPREPVHLRRGSHQYGHCGHAWRYVSIRFRCCIYHFAVEKPNCWYLLITVC